MCKTNYSDVSGGADGSSGGSSDCKGGANGSDDASRHNGYSCGNHSGFNNRRDGSDRYNGSSEDSLMVLELIDKWGFSVVIPTVGWGLE